MPPATQTRVIVLDKHGKPLMPCSAYRARELLRKKRARVHSIYPFAIRLVDRTLEDSVVQPVEMVFDPGSKQTGIAIFRVEETTHPQTGEVSVTRHALFLGEIEHRGMVEIAASSG